MTPATMNDPRRVQPVLRTGLIAGTCASLASTAALMLLGRREAGSMVAPTNATSHWLWGDDEAFAARRPTLRHTGVGYATHHASAVFWALLYAWLHAGRHPPRSVPQALAGAAAATAVACTIDYTVTPRRLTPGFERHLSTPSMGVVYGLFAVGLAAGCLLAQRGARSR